MEAPSKWTPPLTLFFPSTVDSDSFAVVCRVLLSRIERYILDRQVPMGVQDLKPSLFFFLVRFLIRIKLLDERAAIKIIGLHCRALENDGHAIVPSAIFRGVIAWPCHTHF